MSLPGIAGFFSPEVFAEQAPIHHVPIIVQATKLRSLTHYALNSYRLFRTGKNGEAVVIPFQLDELNEWGDYVLTTGKNLINDKSNGVFDNQDELAFMGDDVGPAKPPSKWNFPKPSLLKEIRLTYRGKNPIGPDSGAVYLGVYLKNTAPALSPMNYVVFNQAKAQVLTSRFRYKFDRENYLVVEGVDMVKKAKGEADGYVPLITTSTFYMKADLKYFLTFEVNHRDINSSLEAFKAGPIRTIVRVIFFYKFLKINFELGMYTEVSIFSNSVLLPAVIYNPLNGNKNLNKGSGFYYGFAITDNPESYDVKTNIPFFEQSDNALLDLFKQQPKSESLYWLSMSKPDRMMYFEVVPSKEMLELQNYPRFYRQDKSAESIYENYKNKGPQPLGKSPVNLALQFDLTKFKEGEHKISFRLFFENHFSEDELKSYPEMSKWDVETQDF